MTLLSFVVDTSRLGGLLLKSVQQCLLELADLVALRPHRRGSTSRSEGIGLCTLSVDSDTKCYKLDVKCEARAPFNLRDFHHAVMGGLTEVTGPQDGNGQVSSLSALIERPWSPESSSKRIIMISSCFSERSETFKRTVLNAASRCIMIDFIEIDVAEYTNDQCLHAQPKHGAGFQMDIAEFENCTFENSPCISRFVKRWLQDLASDDEVPLEGALVFPTPLVNRITNVYCTFYPAVLQLCDVIKPCEACRCHGVVLTSQNKRTFCPVTGRDLDNIDLASNSVKIGNETVVRVPSSRDFSTGSEAGRPPLTFTVLAAVNLALLGEGLLFGLPHVVVASSDADLDLSPCEGEERTSNDQTFAALCQVLHSKDSGILCSSKADLESGADASFPCFYVLLPGENGSFLAKRIAASEEFLPLPPPIRAVEVVPDSLKDTIASSLSKIDAQPYDPLQHQRGCHTVLSGLLKESLQFRPTMSERMQAQPADMHFTTAAKVLSRTATWETPQTGTRRRKNLHNITTPGRRDTAAGKPSLPVQQQQQQWPEGEQGSQATLGTRCW